MKIIQVVPYIGNEASGPSYSAVRLAYSLAALGNSLFLMSVKDGELSNNENFNHRVFAKSTFPAKLWRSPQMYHELSRQAKFADIVHSHGMWVMPSVYTGWATRHNDSRLVVSPRGTLSSWALSRSALIKNIFWRLVQKPAIRHADCLHATAFSEYKDIRLAGLGQPVCIIPNGIDIPEYIATPPLPYRTILFLGRIHPVKGVKILLQAWHRVMGQYPEWRLHIVGPDDDSYLEKMQRVAVKLKLQRIEFAGPLFGEEKLRAYRSAELFILPTYSENFGMTVAESLAAGTPAIVSKGAPWKDLETNQAGWWIDIGLDPLSECLERVLAMPPELLAARGIAGREWMLREFSWHRIATMMETTYRWLVEGGKSPGWVKLD